MIDKQLADLQKEHDNFQSRVDFTKQFQQMKEVTEKNFLDNFYNNKIPSSVSNYFHIILKLCFQGKVTPICSKLLPFQIDWSLSIQSQ